MAHNGPSFQEVIMRLERFWAQQGCVIWQPHNVQVGAGTMNPATVLRVLGPEPWRVAYVEPSVRPADGRYAENPNRWQQFYQYQVILKPDPGDPQEMYLRSLEAIGVDLAKHDVRFVEDNWQSPALGAWGLGWEVWCDGQEISQYTYMQQAGGFTCDPVSVEMTYGLERIMLVLQEARTFLDIAWEQDLTYGDLFHRQEVEHCTYNFEVADVERLTSLYRIYEKEALVALERGLVMPAHDYVLKCSHTFNVLDARGAVGVTERAGFFARMREIAHRVSEAYLQQRQELGYPLLKKQSWLITPSPVAVAPMPLAADHLQEFLLEIGTEELPHGDLGSALDQLRQRLPATLAEARLGHGAFEVMGTPRRLAVLIHDLAPRQTDDAKVVKGPPAQVAFDVGGKPTRAAEGFAKRQGLPVGMLEVAEMDGGRYAVARISQDGQPTGTVLARALPGLISSLRFSQSMRWNGSGVSFSRPIRWLVALLDGDIVPFEYAGLYSGRCSRGFRMSGQDCLEIAAASEYLDAMGNAGIVLSTDERRRLILERVKDLAALAGGQWHDDAGLLAEVADLVEAPTPILGCFAEEYLSLPTEVLVTVMKKHQRYFAVEREGKLLPCFIAVRNAANRTADFPRGGKEGEDLVRQGNEAVLGARFADAAFFSRRDLSRSLEEFLPRLDTLAFQERLGSMLDKTRRLEELAPVIGAMLAVTEAEMPLLRRAARLCKADLATQMVVEFTSLQGAIGRIYARQQGEDERVAAAIFEHYLPRSAGDASPQGRLGLVLGIADRLDSVLGLLAAGLEPSGSADPYALRRAASGIVQNLVHWKTRFDLRAALDVVAARLPLAVDEATRGRALAFIIQRLRAHLQDQGIRYDVIDAVLAERGHDPYWAAETARGLQEWVGRPDWMDTLNAYSRCKRIVRDVAVRYQVKAELLADEASRALYAASSLGESAVRFSAEAGNSVSAGSSIGELLYVLKRLTPTINRFFDEVLVMAEDQSVRESRLALVQSVAALTEGIADLSRLEGF